MDITRAMMFAIAGVMFVFLRKKNVMVLTAVVRAPKNR